MSKIVFNLKSGNLENSTEGSSRLSGSVSAYVNSSGAGGHSSITTQSSTGEIVNSQENLFIPGATSASASATGSASAQNVTASAQVKVPTETEKDDMTSEEASSSDSADVEGSLLVLGWPPGLPLSYLEFLISTPDNTVLVSPERQSIFIEEAGTDIFHLSAIGGMELPKPDIVLNYSRETGDYLTLREGLTADDLVFEVVDFSGDGNPESTVIRSLIDGSILGIVVNAVNARGESPRELGQPGSSQASSSSSAYVDGSGAGSSSSATATSPAGETSTSSETVYTPGASSSGGTATATANPEGVSTTAFAQSPLLDVLIGTAENDVLVGADNRNIFIGNGGADIFVLFATKKTSLETADIIVDFSPEQGGLIQLPSGITLSDITLQAVDIDSNGTLDGTLIGAIGTGAIYAIALGTVDIFGTSTLAAHNFITPDFT